MMERDTRVVLTFGSAPPIETTTGAIEDAAKRMASRPHTAENRALNAEIKGTGAKGDTPMFKEKEMSSDVNGVARDQLRSLVERIERLEEEKKDLVSDIKDIYAEAKGVGFDTKVLRRVVAIRKQDQNERLEQEAILDLYLHALGMAPAPDEE